MFRKTWSIKGLVCLSAGRDDAKVTRPRNLKCMQLTDSSFWQPPQRCLTLRVLGNWFKHLQKLKLLHVADSLDN